MSICSHISIPRGQCALEAGHTGEHRFAEMAYKVEPAPTMDALTAQVNRLMAEGWKANGAPFRDDLRNLWCQSMIRVEPTRGDIVGVREQKGKR